MTAAAVSAGDAERYVTTCAERLARSDIVAWLLKNHDKVIAATVRRALRWEELAQALYRDGVRTIRGGAPSGASLRVTWYRVRKFMTAQRLEAAAAAERRQQEPVEEEARRDALRETARAAQRSKTAEALKLQERMAAAERAAAWDRERENRRREDETRASALHEARATGERGAKEVPAAPPQPEHTGQLVSLDLPQIPGVSRQAYLPHDPALPPVREGDRNPVTGIRWEIGDDLPGYPSKRHYEYELEWLRDVGQLLRARHPTNLTMTREEKYVMRTAKSRIPNLF